jgi:hypothetical protein
MVYGCSLLQNPPLAVGVIRRVLSGKGLRLTGGFGGFSALRADLVVFRRLLSDSIVRHGREIICKLGKATAGLSLVLPGEGLTGWSLYPSR